MLIPGQLVRWLLKRRDAPTVGVYAVVEAVAGDAVTIWLDNGDCYTVPPKQLFVLPEEITMKMSALFPSKYVKAADLNGKTVTLTIDKLVIEEMGHGNEKERKPVLYFQKATKGLVLNRTNAMTISGLYGDESDNWKDKRISIYPTTVRAFGATHDTIRVREEIPAQPKPQSQAQSQVEDASEIDDVEDVTDPEESPAAPDAAFTEPRRPRVTREQLGRFDELGKAYYGDEWGADIAMQLVKQASGGTTSERRELYAAEMDAILRKLEAHIAERVSGKVDAK